MLGGRQREGGPDLIFLEQILLLLLVLMLCQVML
jgi:hypothetical protein